MECNRKYIAVIKTHSCGQGFSWLKKIFNLYIDWAFMSPEKPAKSQVAVIQLFDCLLFCLLVGVSTLKRIRGKIFWAALCANFSFMWSKSSIHRWRTNFLLRVRCTRLDLHTAQQSAHFAANAFERQSPANVLMANITCSIDLWCNAPRRLGFVFALLHFSLCLQLRTCQIILHIDQNWSKKLKHGLLKWELISLDISTSLLTPEARVILAAILYATVKIAVNQANEK